MSPASPVRLQQRLTSLLALCAILAFVSGAGATAAALVPAAALLVLSLFWFPGERLRRTLELVGRALAVLLAVRAGYHALFIGDDVVLPMVDLLLLLLLAETYRAQPGTGEARIYALSFALLIAATAYRPGSVFALAFVGYLAVLTVALTSGQLTRQALQRGLRPPRLARTFLLQSAAFSGIALAVSLLVFLAFPRVSWGARGSMPVRTLAGFSDRVSLLQHGSRITANPETVLRIEFPDGLPPAPALRYWRGRSYDRFDGWTWSRTSFRQQPLINERAWPGARLEQLIYQAGIEDANVLFGLSPPVRVVPRSRIVVYEEPNGDFTYTGQPSPVYAARSVLGQPTAEQLRAAAALPRPARTSPAGQRESWTLRPYLQLPLLSPRFYVLADSLERAHANPYDRAVAAQEWLQRGFRYTLDLPRTEREAALEFFMFQRRAGHCEYFSTAMVLLLRAMDIPARNVNGFLGGEWNQFGDFLTVTQNEAHSWVEGWFPGFGWVRFDPTPAGQGPGTGTAARALSWLGPLRLLFGGLEHRWGKWVLDYDLDDQARLVERAAGGLGGGRQEGRPLPSPDWRLLSGLAALAVLGAAAVRLFRGAHPPAGPVSGRPGITRTYLRLRRAYARAGYDAASPPLGFVEQLRQAGAPGAPEAAAAVDIYTRLRFGPRRPYAPRDEPRQLRRAVRAARRQLRQAGRRPR